ncbi:hypothetical protein LGQ02_10060 [Bacillus shivajii]|uniref:hypothetical protein n=1 Tax=Bacillus shivajii TaxID=1983719 RepID=UPI001CFA2119|nr:hypothetical protein [Bacillus shivajii]UCZ55037.1 hypothetical protein LGQ02_10060 [Bacillus shivajii]
MHFLSEVDLQLVAPAVTRRSSKQFKEVMLVAPAVTRRSSKQFEEVMLVAVPAGVATFHFFKLLKSNNLYEKSR